MRKWRLTSDQVSWIENVLQMSRCSALYIKILHNIFYTLVLLLLSFYLFLFKSLLLSHLLFNKQCLVQLIHSVLSPSISPLIFRLSLIYLPPGTVIFPKTLFDCVIVTWTDLASSRAPVYAALVHCFENGTSERFYLLDHLLWLIFPFSRYVYIAHSFHTDQKVY